MKPLRGMRSPAKKSAVREIRASIGRYAAILAIVCLGVGFFVGLRVCRDAMVTTADGYLSLHRFFDYRLVSTLGFSKEDPDILSQVDGLSGAEGALQKDFLYVDASGDTRVLKAHSITQSVNTLALVAGRMPETPHEAVGDSRLFAQADLGMTIPLSCENDEDTFDAFAFDEYTLVGVAHSPLYLNYERGTTSLGNGSVAGFVYLPRDGFSMDYWTEIYLKLDSSDEIYSDAYQAAVDASEAAAEQTAELLGEKRYDKVVLDARAEIDDGWAEYRDGALEYEDGKAEADQELTDAYAKLTDAQMEIEKNEKKLIDAQAELNDGREEYEDGKDQLASSRRKLQAQKDAAQTQLDAAKADLDQKYADAQDGLAQLTASGVIATYDTLKQNKAALEAGLQQAKDQRQALLDSESALSAALDQAKAALAQRKAAHEQSVSDLNGQISQKQASIAAAQAEIASLEGTFSAAEIEALQGEVASEDMAISTLQESLASTNAEHDARIAAAQRAKQDADAALAANQGAISALDNEISALEGRLSAAKSALFGMDAVSDPAGYQAKQAEIADLESQISARKSARGGLAGQTSGLQTAADGAAAALSDAQSAKQAATAPILADISTHQGKRNAAQQKLTQQTDGQARYADLSAQIQRDQASLTGLNDQLSAENGAWAADRPALEAAQAQAQAQLDAFSAQKVGALAALSATESDLNANLTKVNGSISAIEASGSVDAYNQLTAGIAQIEAGYAQLEQRRAAALAAFAPYDAQIEQAQAELDAAKGDIESGQREIDDGWKEIEDANAKYLDGLIEYEDGREEAMQELRDGKKELDDAYADLMDAEAELRDLEPAKTYALGRDTNAGYVCFDSDSSIVGSISLVFPVFFFLVAALVCMTTMTRMVDEQRTQIGVLKALGYSKRAIMGKYMFYAGSAATLGSAIGFFGGTWLFPTVIWQAYGIMYGFSKLTIVFDYGLGAASYGAAMLCAVGATWFSCWRQLEQQSAQLMRPAAPKAGKRILLERIPFLWRRLKFLRKVSIRNIVRYKKRMLMMIVGIGGCTALLVTGFGIRDSISNVVNYQYSEITLYDISVTFQNPMEEADQAEFLREAGNAANQCLFAHESTVDLDVNGQTKSVIMMVTDADDLSGILDLHTPQDQPVSLPGRGGAVVSRGLRDSYGVNVGDHLTLRTGDMDEISVTVEGVYDNYVYNYVILTQNTYADAAGEFAPCKTAFVNVSEGGGIHAASARISAIDGVSAVSVNEDTRLRVNNMLSSLIYIVIMVIVCAGALAFIVLYNLTNININERIREIATIKVLGFYPGETNAYVFSENLALCLMGAVAGLGLGKLLHAFVMAQIKIDMMCFDVRVLPMSYVWSICLTMVFAALVDVVMAFRLKRVSMTESLKAVE